MFLILAADLPEIVEDHQHFSGLCRLFLPVSGLFFSPFFLVSFTCDEADHIVQLITKGIPSGKEEPFPAGLLV